MPADALQCFARFPTTRWSLVDRAGREGAEAEREALGLLLARYLPALRSHLIHSKRLQPADADDVLQDFVAAKVLERDLIARANEQLGKFRTFLLTALDRFLLNRIRNGKAQKRVVGAAVNLGDEDDGVAASGRADAYDVEWARQVIDEAVSRMRAECQAAGRDEIWGMFECRVLALLDQDAAPLDYGELVRRFGFQSPSQASNTLVTAKRMYARILRSVIGEYARDGAEVEAEIDELHRILTRSG
jgi:DNA-directed RNA polymerase specialized sigma24 family protein